MNVLAFLLAGYAWFSRPVPAPLKTGDDIDKTDLEACCQRIINGGQRIYFLGDRNGKMKLQVKAIYVHGSVLFFFLQLINRSSADYAFDGIRFSPADRDGRPVGRSAALEPVFVYDSTKMVPGNSRAASIFVLPRFTLPAGGRLWIELRERNGGRQLRIPVSNWTLARARLI